MKEQVQAFRHGWFKLGLSLFSIALSLCNIISTISKGYSLLATFPYWFPFLLFPLLLIFLDLKDVLFFASLFIGVVLTIYQGGIGDLQGALFFILALNLYSDKISLLVVLFGILVGILGRSFILGMTMFQSIGLFAGFLVCVMIFYIPRVINDV